MDDYLKFKEKFVYSFTSAFIPSVFIASQHYNRTNSELESLLVGVSFQTIGVIYGLVLSKMFLNKSNPNP